MKKLPLPSPALSVVLPVHNEATIIAPVFGEVIKVLKKTADLFECILVENGSTDDTYEVVKQLSKKYQFVRVLVAPKGYGSAVLAGLKQAKGRYVCYMPSDGQIDLGVFPRLWGLAKKNQWDVIKIKRITRESFGRVIVSKLLSLAVAVLFGAPVIDVNGSPRIVSRKNISSLHLISRDSFIDVEFIVKAHRRGWKIKEIPMRTLPRSGGISTRSWRTYWEFIRNLVRYRLSNP